MKKIFAKWKPEDVILSLAGIIVLAILYFRWRLSHPDTTAAGVRAAFFSAAVFAIFGVRLVHRWMEEWRCVRGERTLPALREPVRPWTLIKIFLACLLAGIAALLLVYALEIVDGMRAGFWDAARLWERLDTQHYFAIAEQWYLSEGSIDRLVQLVFLPGYPLAVRLFHLITGDWLKAGVFVSVLSFSGAGVMLYLLARFDLDHLGALRALKYTLILPGGFFFAAPMSESLFFLLSVSCLYCIRRQKWPAAGILGGLAAFTRSLGLVLIVPMGYALVTAAVIRPAGDKRAALRRILPFLSLLLIPAGFGAYCLICRSVSGDAFKFLEYQREHWGQSPGLFFDTAAYQTEYAAGSIASGDMETFLGLWLPNLFCSLGALFVMALAVRRLRPVYSMYFLAYYVVAIGATWLLSAPRYLVACAPLGLGLSSLTDDRRRDGFMTVFLTVLYVIYAIFMVKRWQVW